MIVACRKQIAQTLFPHMRIPHMQGQNYKGVCTTVVLKRFRPPMSFLLKVVQNLIYLDNAQYLTEHLTAALLCVSKALYTKQFELYQNS